MDGHKQQRAIKRRDKKITLDIRASAFTMMRRTKAASGTIAKMK